MYAVLISSNTEEVNEIYSYMQRAVEEIQQPVFYGEKKRNALFSRELIEVIEQRNEREDMTLYLLLQ